MKSYIKLLQEKKEQLLIRIDNLQSSIGYLDLTDPESYDEFLKTCGEISQVIGQLHLVCMELTQCEMDVIK